VRLFPFLRLLIPSRILQLLKRGIALSSEELLHALEVVRVPDIDLRCGVLEEVEPVFLVPAEASVVAFDFGKDKTAISGGGVVR
jgi:hypothetical protein